MRNGFNFLSTHPNLTVTKCDARDIDSINLKEVDIIIHLSSVANDPCGDLDPKLTWEISALATMQLADKAVRQGVKQFIFASSGSVYGIKDLELKPISKYNKTCEFSVSGTLGKIYHAKTFRHPA